MEGGRLGVSGVNAANPVIPAHDTAHEVARIQLPALEVKTVVGNLIKPNPAYARVSPIDLLFLLPLFLLFLFSPPRLFKFCPF